MNIKDFAARYGVEARKDGCGDLVIPGWQYVTSRRCPEYACHIFDNGDGLVLQKWLSQLSTASPSPGP